MAQLPDDWDILYLAASMPNGQVPSATRWRGSRERSRPSPTRSEPGRSSRSSRSTPHSRSDRRPAHAAPGAARLLLHLPPRRLGRGRHSDIQGARIITGTSASRSCWATTASDDMVGAIALVDPDSISGLASRGPSQIEFLVDHSSPHLRGLSVVLDDGPPPQDPATLAARAFRDARRADRLRPGGRLAGLPAQRHIIAALADVPDVRHRHPVPGERHAQPRGGGTKCSRAGGRRSTRRISSQPAGGLGPGLGLLRAGRRAPRAGPAALRLPGPLRRAPARWARASQGRPRADRDLARTGGPAVTAPRAGAPRARLGLAAVRCGFSNRFRFGSAGSVCRSLRKEQTMSA